MARRQKNAPGRREPTLKEQIDASGETEADPVRQALSQDQEDRRFLGREFLTWLLYHADEENGGGEFRDEEDQAFRVQVGERVVLEALGDGQGLSESMARGAAPAQTADVRYAIAGGLTVREAELFLLRGDRVWQFSLTAEMFDVKRAKVPDLLSEEEAERATERLELLDDLYGMLRAAYGTFLAERLRPAWDTDTMPRLRAWLARSILLNPSQHHAPGPLASEGVLA